jgi:hypothetical protein
MMPGPQEEFLGIKKQTGVCYYLEMFRTQMAPSLGKCSMVLKRIPQAARIFGKQHMFYP